MIPTAVRLAPSYRVWVPDLPGFGRSAKPPHILTVTELADEGELFTLPKCQLTSDGSLVISLDQWLQAASARLGSVQEMNVEQGQVASGHEYQHLGV